MKRNIRAFFFAPLNASVTVEAAVVLPIFLLVMLSVMQYSVMLETSVRFGTAMAETAKEMAMTSYLSKYGGEGDGFLETAAGVLSSAYAHQKVKSKSGDTTAVKNANMALSSFLKEGEMIDLVLTYQIKSPISSVKLPGNFFIQRAQVRGWVGRSPEDGQGDGAEGENGNTAQVYVTATGTVYHKDENCTHLKLSVKEVNLQSLDAMRNEGGAIYHPCENCGEHASREVYITDHGTRYHSTLSCSGLKRTVKQMPLEELDGMKACSKCGG